MYFREGSTTHRITKNERVDKKTILTTISGCNYRPLEEDALDEIIPGHYYYGIAGLEFFVIKCLENNRIIAKLRESCSLTLPFLCIDEFDAKIYGIDYQEGLFIVSSRFLVGKRREVSTFKNILLTIPGFKVYDDFHVIGRDNLMIDLELFLVSLTVRTEINIESVGNLGAIPKGTVLKHRISTKGNRGNNHIIGEDGTLKIEVSLPKEVYLFKKLPYFQITYDDSFSINSITGESIGETLKVEPNHFYVIPNPYFDKDRWKIMEY